MARKECAQMIKARKLVLEKGFSAAEAARKSGISRQAIYMSAWWKEFKKSI